MRQLSISSGPAGTLLVAGNTDNPQSQLIQNVDPANTLYLGINTAVNASNPLESVPLLPGQSTVADGTVNVFGIAGPGQTVQVNVLAGITSFFQPPNIPVIPSTANIYIQATAPTQPPSIPLNSLWLNSTTNSLWAWNGTTWVKVAFSGTQLIEAGTIDATLIAAGTVVAGVIDGTTVKAGQVIAQGTQGEILVYTGTAALGNLLASISGANGTDVQGNQFLTGIAVYNGKQLINMIGSPAPAVNFFTGAVGEAQFGSVYLLLQNAGAVNESELLWVKGPASTFDNVYAAIALFSSNKDGSNIGNGNLVTQAGISAFWDYQGVHINQTLWGAAGNLAVGDSIKMASGRGIYGRDAGWVGVGLGTGWTNRGGNYPNFQVMRSSIAPGVVWIRGSVGSSTTIANGATFATFGAGYIPTSTQVIPATSWGGTAVYNAAQLHIEVTVTGAVNVWGITTSGTVDIAFSGVYFLDAL